MSTFTNIEDFNQHLADNSIKKPLMIYFKEIHRLLYSTIDISFMEYFMELCANKDKFIIHHTKLKEYGVITTDKSNHVLAALNQYKLTIDIDYLLVPDVRQSRRDGKHGGSNGNKKEYMLTQRAFKICLMRSKNTLIYADYYMLLEEILNHFNNYERLYTAKLLSSKNDKITEGLNKIDRLINKVDEQSLEMSKQSQEIQELLVYTKDSNRMLITANESLNIAHDKIDNLTDTVSKLVINVANYSNFSPLTNRALKITKMIQFIVFNINDNTDYVEVHCMYYSLENTMTRLKIKHKKYGINNDRTIINILGSTNPRK